MECRTYNLYVWLHILCIDKLVNSAAFDGQDGCTFSADQRMDRNCLGVDLHSLTTVIKVSV